MGHGVQEGHKPALRFSSRRASAFQRPWMASGSSKGVRARQPLYHGADSSARIDANGRRSRCPQPGRTAPRTTPGAPLISASEYDFNPLSLRARKATRVFGENSLSKAGNSLSRWAIFNRQFSSEIGESGRCFRLTHGYTSTGKTRKRHTVLGASRASRGCIMRFWKDSWRVLHHIRFRGKHEEKRCSALLMSPKMTAAVIH